MPAAPSAVRATAILLAAFAAGLVRPATAAAPSPEQTLAQQLLAMSAAQGGLVVHLGCGDGTLTAALHASPRYRVHGLDTDPRNVDKARAHIRSRGLYGPVAVDRWTTAPRLPYVDNLVNLLIVSGQHKLAPGELLRVLAPGGVACVQRAGKWTATVKPRPKAIDDWSHTLHDARNNAVAHDTVVGPPHHLHWVAEPRNARHHERLASITVVVSAGGRLFTIADEAPTASILLPPQWALIARDAFSSIVLWKRPIPDWEPHLRGFRSGPPDLARRLVATPDRVYVTLGIHAPLTALHPATGRTLATYDGTEGTEEILHRDGILFLVIRPDAASRTSQRHLMAIDAATGTVLWTQPDAHPLPTAVAVDAGRLVYVHAGGLAALDARTGKPLWRAERPVAAKRPGWSAPTLVAHGDVVLCADRQPTPATNLDESTGKNTAGWLAQGGYPGDLIAYSAATGDKLWSCRAAETYHAPIDVFVVDGLVWYGRSRSRTGPADFNIARDIHTGKIVRRIDTAKAFKTTMPHHRCHRNRATSRYIVGGRTGVEFIDLATGAAFRHHWVRGTCQFGVVPCNGLLYAPPHACACFIEAKLTGFLALAPASAKTTAGRPARPRLVRGPAFSVIGNRQSAIGNSSDWPTYRHDPARTGATTAPVPADLHRLWQAKLGGRLSSPVVAGGLAFVASIDTHTVHALDARTGKPAWSTTVGGRIDSPPTIAQGRAVFGSADGWVHCLRATDGALAWRFRAAPADRRVVAFGQIESPWPVHGSVLITDGVVTCAAGRTSYLDGGIHLYRLDLATGRTLAERRLTNRDPKTGEQPAEPIMFEMPGALPDVLSTDGTLVYMRHLAFDPATLEPREAPAHLYSPAGFLNGDWWHRTYWIYGRHFYSGYIGWYFAGRENPAGRILSLDPTTIYGFAYKPTSYRGATGRQYHLFAAPRKDQPDPGPPDYRRASRDYAPRRAGKFTVKFRWQKDLPLLGRAMVLAGDTLFVAGPPDRALRSPLAFQGKRGAVLAAVAAADGKPLRQYKLDALPAFDGMAAAGGRLFLTLANGTLLCLGTPDPGTHAPPLQPLPSADAASPGKPKEPGLAGHWPLDDGAGPIARDTSGIGNDAEIHGRWVTGAFGTCILTRGIPGAVTIPDAAPLHFGTDSFSIQCWLKPDRYNTRLLGKEDFPRTWWVINILPDGRAELVLGTGLGKSKSVRPTAKTPLPKNRWTHLAFVVDRAHRTVACYIDGKPDSTTPIPPGLTGGLSIEGKDLRIPSTHKPFVGLIDDLKLHRRPLTHAEIKASHDRDRPKRASIDYR